MYNAIHEQACNGFAYCYANLPIYDIQKNTKYNKAFFTDLYNFVNSRPFLELCRRVTGEDAIAFADIQVTRFSAGNFLTQHNDFIDGKNRIAAYVLNLTPVWHHDWGGALLLSDGPYDYVEALFPSFNTLNLFQVPQRHSVSLVSPFAGASRYAITGWLRQKS